jgi:hypothetical protein
MFLKGRTHPPSSRSLLILLLVFAVLFSSLGQTWAQSRPALLGSSSALPSSSTPASSGIVTAICEPPPICFQSKEARQAYAQQHQCQFLEDVCEKTPASADNKGAPTADQGFWSGLWGSVSSGLTYGYEFGKGLFSGLKGQITDIIDLISNPLEVAQGLAALGKAFYDDPKGTLVILGELLGQGAVDTITKATQCGAYDLGKVIGSYVSPAVMLKLATRLGKYSGKLGDAVKATKLELGCASFAAGTLVWTAQGMVPIETVAQGAMVASRHDALWSDAPQRVDNTFGRMAPRYRVLRTEFESIRLTDEHPLWVQGKGWTAAQDLTDEDVLASAQGDALVLENTPVAQPLRVYNFSVDQTHNYFVGASGLWAHNAKCELTRTADIQNTTYKLLDRGQKGFKGELVVREALEAKGYTVIKAVGKHDGAYDAWKGKGGIDGIYKDKDGNYVIVESKATGGVKPSDPEGCVAGLCKLTGGERQMSTEWLLKRIKGDESIPQAERDAIQAAIKNGNAKRIYAQTDDAGTTFHEINSTGTKDATIGKTWNP